MCCADSSSGNNGGRLGGFSASQVEEVRMVLRLMPIFFTTILFWTIYVQVRLQIRVWCVVGLVTSPERSNIGDEVARHKQLPAVHEVQETGNWFWAGST